MKNNDLILVIDLQKVYCPGNPWACPNLPKAVKNIQTLLDTVIENTASDAEELSSPDVILTRFIADLTEKNNTWEQYNRLNKDIIDDPVMNEFLPEIAAYVEHFPYYDKSTYSSFRISALRDAAARTTDAGGRIILTGVVAECCVLATFFEGCDLGCHFIYLTDAVAGIDDATEHAVETVLKGLSPLHVECMTTEQYLSET